MTDATPATVDDDGRPARRRRREKTALWYVSAALCLPLLTLMARFPVIDGHKLPRQGAFILAPNHYSEIDPVIMGRFMWKLGRVPRFLAKASVFRVPVLGAILRWSGQIPVEREGRGRPDAPLKAAQQLVDRELAIIIYPEGTRSLNGEMAPLKKGPAMIASELNIPIVPAYMHGTFASLPKFGKFPKPRRINVYFGEPIHPQRLAKRDDVCAIASTRQSAAWLHFELPRRGFCCRCPTCQS